MKKITLKPVLILLFLAFLIYGCSKEEALPEEKVSMEMEEIISVRNADGEIEGWYYLNAPDNVYLVENTTTYVTTESSDEIVNLVGDMDVFGFFPSRTHPECAYYDLSEAEDLGIFDRLVKGPSDAEKIWNHDFRNDPQFCSGFTAEEVIIQIKEYFNDTYGTVKILIDGIELDFTQNGILSECSGKHHTVQTFTFTGADAAFANDGVINIEILENGEEIALDYSLVTVKFSLTSPTDNITISGCDTGVVDQLRDCKTISEIIDIAHTDAKNHGAFVSEVSHLTTRLMDEGLLSEEQRVAIMNCTAKAQ